MLNKTIVLFFLLGLVILTGIQCSEQKEESAVEEKQYASLDPGNGYVGMETCKTCHESIYNTFIETGMGKSFDVASRTKSSGNFKNHEPVYDKYLDFYYLPFWESDSLKVLEYRLDGKDTVYKRIEAVSHIVGSGQHTNSHIMNTFGYLNQVPLTFYTQKGKWDLPPGFENGGNSRFSRVIGLECISCHNSYPEFIAGSENRFDFIDNGINCERCHGPGEQHVKAKMSGDIVDVVNGIDYSIVNPAKLPIDLQLDVCQRCHIQGNAVLKEGKSFFDFKPGMKLSDVMDVYMPVYKGRENEHIMASHVERMKLSKCFTESTANAMLRSTSSLRPYKNALTCVTCHNPHVSVRNNDNSHFNQACNNCHSSEKNNLCTEDPIILTKNNNNCVNCHMPSSGATDIPHVAVHDHLIRIPVEESKISQIKEFIGINCINNPDADNLSKGRAFIAYFEKFNYGKEVLDSAKKYFPSNSLNDKITNFKYLVHIYFLEQNYKAVTELSDVVPGEVYESFKADFSNTDAWTAYRIGQSYYETGNIQKAVFFFNKAYYLAASIPEFANKYATALIQANETTEARKILERSIRNYSKYPPTLSNLGYLILVTENNTRKAGEYYDKALALDPDYEQAVINKAGLLVAEGNLSQAQTLLKNYLKRRPGSLAVADLIRKITAS